LVWCALLPLFGIKGSVTKEDKYCQLSERLSEEYREINVTCNAFNVSPLNNHKRECTDYFFQTYIRRYFKEIKKNSHIFTSDKTLSIHFSIPKDVFGLASGFEEVDLR